MSSRLLVAHDVAEVPRLWTLGQQEAFAQTLERVAVGKETALDVAGSTGGIRVVAAPQNHRLYYQPGTGSRVGTPTGLKLYALGHPPAEELLVRPGVVGPDARPLATLSELVLQSYGVPPQLVRAVRNAPTLDALLKLRLPDEVLARLQTFCVAAAPANIDFIPGLLKYDISDVGILQHYYLGDIKRLLLNLEPHQRDLVDLNSRGPILVKGVAGSGKTTVALYRAKRLLMDSPATQPRVLILSFTKALTQAAGELLSDLCERAVPELTVETVHAWCYHHLEARGRRPRMVDAKKRQRETALGMALTAVRATSKSEILSRPEEFWTDEFSQVIKGRCAARWDDYRSIERVGRGDGLRLQGREVVWKVFDAYQKNLTQLGCIDWDDLVLQTLTALESDSTFEPYEHVFLDEAQDLSVMALRLVARLVRDPSGLFLMADGRQSIYQKGFRWKDIGLEVRGGVHTLRRNFRSTIEVVAAADSLRAASVDDVDEEQVVPPVRHGPLPKMVGCSTREQECAFVVGQIASLLRENAAAPANIGVLARSIALLRQLREELEREGIPTRMHNEGSLSLGDPTVKLLTLHSAKGLEFPIVFIVGVDRGVLPEEMAIDDSDEAEAHATRERRLLYVGMTRGMQDLTVVYDASQPSVFIEQLDHRLFSLVDPSPSGMASAGLPQRDPSAIRATAPAAQKADQAWNMIGLLKEIGAEFIDKRPLGGALWIIDSDLGTIVVESLKRRGVLLNYKENGGRAARGRAAWWTTDKR